MEYVLSIILILSFVGMAIYCIKGGNIMVSMLGMAAFWTIIAIIGKYAVTNPEFIADNAATIEMNIPAILAKVFQAGPEGWGGVIVHVCFGAFFGRVLLDSGIVAALIRKTVELGGDRPIITFSLLCIVSMLCFSTMNSPGAVISIGIIVFPIMLSLGIPKQVATWAYVASVAAGLFVNPIIFAQHLAYYQSAQGAADYTYQMNLPWAITMSAMLLVIIILVSSVLIKKQRVATWAVVAQEDPNEKNVPGLALITPVLPVILIVALDMPIIFSLLFSAFFALALCGRLKGFDNAVKTIVKTFHDGVVDTAPLMGFFLCVPIFCAAANLCAPYFRVLLAPIMPENPLFIFLAVAALAPLGMYRGPLTIVGAGAVTVAILNGVGLPIVLMFPLIEITTMIMNSATCLTQSWNSWAVGYTKCAPNDFLKLSIPVGWITTIIMIIVTYIMRVGF